MRLYATPYALCVSTPRHAICNAKNKAKLEAHAVAARSERRAVDKAAVCAGFARGTDSAACIIKRTTSSYLIHRSRMRDRHTVAQWEGLRWQSGLGLGLGAPALARVTYLTSPCGVELVTSLLMAGAGAVLAFLAVLSLSLRGLALRLRFAVFGVASGLYSESLIVGVQRVAVGY